MTSPFYTSWVRSAPDDFAEATSAIRDRDFEKLAHIAELNCLKMHGVMITSQPTLSYWNAASLACMDTVRSLREQGSAVFFTNDAGPQIKAVCLPESTNEVKEALTQVPGVDEVLVCSLGSGAHTV